MKTALSAVEHGIAVLAFLLDDGENNWPEEFDERETDAEIGRWRVRLQSGRRWQRRLSTRANGADYNG